VAEGVGGAPLVPSEEPVVGLVQTISAGQSLLETIAAHPGGAAPGDRAAGGLSLRQPRRG